MCLLDCPNAEILDKHIVRIHRNDPRFHVFCTEENCEFSTSNWYSFKNHQSKKHRPHIVRNDGVDGDDIVDNDMFDMEAIIPHNEESFAKESAAYLLRLETEKKIPIKTIDEIVLNTNKLIELSIDAAKNQIKRIVPNEYHQMVDQSQHISPFHDLQTRHMREKFYLEKCGLVLPKNAVMGHSISKKNGHLIKVSNFGYYIPFKALLQTLLSLPEVSQCVASDHICHDDDTKRDICDGLYYKYHPVFSDSHSALQIILYADDLEITNPVGTHTKKHKICAFYFTLGNLYPEHRSQLSSIFLLAIAKTKYVKKHGINALLRDFITTINQLSSTGIEFTINNEQKCIKGALIMVQGDTPAAQWLGGFKEGVAFAHMPCRTCKIDQNELKHVFSDSNFRNRSFEEYTEMCSALEDSNLTMKSRKFWSKMWGINQRSVLAKVSHFDVCKCIVHDPMHVLLEGVLPYELALFLHHAICDNKWFSLNWLNGALQSFPYQSSELLDKPEIIQRKDIVLEVKLKQTSGSMLTMCAVLPFVIGSKVPLNDCKWMNVLSLLQITHMCLSPVVTDTSTNDLRRLIQQHNNQFKIDYPKASIIPKLHYLCHMPDQMENFGPSKYHMCMRFEAKHAFFTNFKWRNFRNLPKSMSTKHQKWLCYQMLNTSGGPNCSFLYAGDEVKEGSELDVTDLPVRHSQLIVRHVNEQLETVYMTPGVKILGVEYRPGCILHLGYDEDLFPKFNYLERVYVIDQEKLFLVRCVNLVELNPHINSYRIEVSNESNIIQYRDMYVPFPLHARQHNNSMYVLDKYAIAATVNLHIWI